MDLQYIDIDKNSIPYQTDIDFANETFTFTFNYNTRFDYFTVDVAKGEDILVYGEKLTYGMPLFSGNVDPRLPQNVVIIPADEADVEGRITWDNLGVSVFLFVGDYNND